MLPFLGSQSLSCPFLIDRSKHTVAPNRLRASSWYGVIFQLNAILPPLDGKRHFAGLTINNAAKLVYGIQNSLTHALWYAFVYTYVQIRTTPLWWVVPCSLPEALKLGSSKEALVLLILAPFQVQTFMK